MSQYMRNFQIFEIFSFLDMVNFLLNILNELRTWTTVSVTLFETESEMLSSDTL